MTDLGLFRRPAFTTAVLGAVAVFAALNVTLLLNTLYLQHARGWTPLAAGLATLPMALGATVCAPLSGNLAGRRGPRLPLLLAGAFTTTGALCLAGLSRDTSVLMLLLSYLLTGIGFGFANAPITTGMDIALCVMRSAMIAPPIESGSEIRMVIGCRKLPNRSTSSP